MTLLRKIPVYPALTPAGAGPTGLVPVPLGKGCLLLLTAEEFVRAIKRGKVWKRTQVLRQRTENRR